MDISYNWAFILKKSFTNEVEICRLHHFLAIEYQVNEKLSKKF